MAKPALSRVAGMIAATVTYAAAATEALAQDGSTVLNGQIQLNDSVAETTLNVVDAAAVDAYASALGNEVLTSVVDTNGRVTSDQTMLGGARATVSLTLEGDTGPLKARADATGKSLGGTAERGSLDLDVRQTVGAPSVIARARIENDTARLLEGGELTATARGNVAALRATEGRVSGSIAQTSTAASIDAGALALTRYIPAAAMVSAQALGNAVQSGGTGASSAALDIRQVSDGALVTAAVSANAGNAWDLAGRARAAANQTILRNAGGSVVAATDQTSRSAVRAASLVTAYDFGRAEASATAAGNSAQVGNNDRYVEVDNSQFNGGVVSADAAFVGAWGYDAQVGAEAVGNNVIAYACAACEGTLVAANSQTNTAAVTSTATASVGGQGRAVVVGANAIGNRATFYVTGPSN
ncbi:MAG: holdfast anchor protein HfaD [Brevundimonas sp.]|uniref:holdfast anchor protein HfaD n=1 Tax=Brevundimonas sp. TaxID=1871086 RepID=UPI00391BEE9C